MDEVVLLDERRHRFEMIGKPEVVVAVVRDQWRGRFPDDPIPMRFSVAGGFGMILETNPRIDASQFIRDESDFGSDSVADDDDLDVGDRLFENAANGESESLVVIMGGHDHQHSGIAGSRNVDQ